MKKLFLFLILISLTCNVALCAYENQYSSQDIIDMINNNNSNYYKRSMAIADLFSYDIRFSNHIRSSWNDFELERERVLNIIYPDVSSLSQNSQTSMLASRASLSAKMNSSKFQSYSAIIDEFCKYKKSENPEQANEACTSAKRMFN